MGEVARPPFPRIAVVGLGLIGGSIAFAARRAWPSTHVVAIDRESVLQEAVARRAIDAAVGDLAEIGDVDLIVLAAPVRQNIVLLRRIAEYASPSTVVTDVGGTKRTIVEAATALAESVTFVAGQGVARGLDHRERREGDHQDQVGDPDDADQDGPLPLGGLDGMEIGLLGAHRVSVRNRGDRGLRMVTAGVASYPPVLPSVEGRARCTGLDVNLVRA